MILTDKNKQRQINKTQKIIFFMHLLFGRGITLAFWPKQHLLRELRKYEMYLQLILRFRSSIETQVRESS